MVRPPEERAAMDTPAPPRPARSWRRRGLLAFLLLLVVAAAGYALLIYLGDRELKAALAEMDRLDPGWRFADLEAARANVPPEENSAPQVLLVRSLIPGGWQAARGSKVFADLTPDVQLNEAPRK